MLLASLVLAPFKFKAITYVYLGVKEAPNGTKGELAIKVKDESGKQQTIYKGINIGPGTGPCRGVIAKDGQTALVHLHYFSRCNSLIEIDLRSRQVQVNTEFGEQLFKQLPTRLQNKTIPDNIYSMKLNGRVLSFEFNTRQERDGVKTKFERKDDKWVYRSAKYWRDPTWDGKRTF